VIQEALEILSEHMEPSKVALLLSMMQTCKDDYLKIRSSILTGETVTILYEKIQAYQKSKE
jgi:hypothetical protein